MGSHTPSRRRRGFERLGVKEGFLTLKLLRLTLQLIPRLPARLLALYFLSLIAAPPESPACQEMNQNIRAEISRLALRLRSSDEEERRDAVVKLSEIESPETTGVLLFALNDRSERVRAMAIDGLSRTGSPQAVDAIAARASSDKSPFVRKEAAYALGRLRSPSGTAALVAALKDKEMEVRGAAAVALGQCGDAAPIEPLLGALSDKSEFVRAQAARALGAAGRGAAVAVARLVTLITSDPDQEVRRQAAVALGLIGEKAALPALERASRDPDPLLSNAAREAINHIVNRP
jgi:HEAT repeat protein